MNGGIGIAALVVLFLSLFSGKKGKGGALVTILPGAMGPDPFAGAEAGATIEAEYACEFLPADAPQQLQKLCVEAMATNDRNVILYAAQQVSDAGYADAAMQMLAAAPAKTDPTFWSEDPEEGYG